jgi:hypothetical protein
MATPSRRRTLWATLSVAALLVATTAARTGTAPPDREAALAADTVPALDSLRTELVRSRGFLRGAETQLSKTLSILDRITGAPADTVATAPTVQDWRTGEWSLLAGGYVGTIDLDDSTATADGVTAPITWTAAGDTLHARLTVPGYEAGELAVVHAEGRLIGTVIWGGETRPAAGERPSLRVVRTVQPTDAAGCTLAQYTDGSWGVAPSASRCHQALDRYVGRLTYVARIYEP